MAQVMTKSDTALAFLNQFEQKSRHIFTAGHAPGYWSNLSPSQNAELVSMLGTRPTRECIEAVQPALSDVIFSDRRAAALELLQLNGTEVAVDYGCMWGAIAIPLAKQAARVLAIDQTFESLRFSEARAQEAGLSNMSFLCGNLRDLQLPPETFDVAIVNGVLEWIPEQEPVVVGQYVERADERRSSGNPGEMQLAFLAKVCTELKPGGRLLLAIENRFDYKMFCGVRDPHTGTLFTTIAPRGLANVISKVSRSREYRPWIYSFAGTEALLKRAGFSAVDLYACWPDYRFPERIQLRDADNTGFSPTTARNAAGAITAKRLIANRLEWLLFKALRLNGLAPSIIAIARR